MLAALAAAWFAYQAAGKTRKLRPRTGSPGCSRLASVARRTG
jgi:hypothetical protein